MYRSKKSGRQAVAATVVHEDSADTTQRSLLKTSSNVSTVTNVMVFKSRLMAPFMFYDKMTRQVVPNPAHDRVFRSEVSRVQGVVLRELRRALECERSSTPKEMLYAVQKSVLLAYASCAVSHDTEALVPLTSDEDAAFCLSQLENTFGERNACAKAVTSLAAVLSTGIVRDTYKDACNRLEARLTAEEQSSLSQQRTKENLLALEATKKNTQDFVHLRESLVTAFEAISVSSSDNGLTPLPNSAASDATTTLLTVESYYSLLGWVLMMQPERLSLAEDRSASVFENASDEANQLVSRVTTYDPAAGQIVIERATLSSKWGLMLNASGNLIGLENALRTATPAGGALYQALQQGSGGLQVFNINDVEISSEGIDAETANAKKVRLERIRDVLQRSEYVISLTVAKVTTFGEPREVAFDIITQGGEGASGQQAVLILKRPSTEVQWQLKMCMRAEGVFILEEVTELLKLSEEAKSFLSNNFGHLLIMHVNGCDTSRSGFIMDVVHSSLYLVLRLRVVGDVSQLVAVAETTQSGEAEVKSNIEGRERVVNATAEPLEERKMAEDEEAEVAHHRALLEEHNIHPDEPLPEMSETDAMPPPKKKGRPKKLKADDDNVDAVVSTTPDEEVNEIPTYVVDADALSATKKKGRPRKLRADDDNVDAVVSTTPDEEVNEIPTYVVDADALPALSEAVKSQKKAASKEKESGKKKLRSKKAMKKAQREAKMRAKEEKKKLKEMKKKKKEKLNEKKAQIVGSDEKETVDITRSLEEAAKAEGVFETPLVKLKSPSEVTPEIVKKTKVVKHTLSSLNATEQNAPGHSVTSVSVAELMDAPPLTFENAVTLDRFDGSHMELRRPDLKTPWDMKVSLGGDRLVLTRLPPISAALKTHPFLKSLQPDTDGHINWCVDKVNGTDLTTANKTLRAKALESIKKANKISLVLRPLVK